MTPARDIARVADAHRRLGSAIATLTDEDVRRPSLVSGWTVGHVLSHLARNADSHVRRSAAAVRGEMVDQYDGGYVGRDAEIEDGSTRPAAALIEDVRRSAAAVDEQWRAIPPDAWPVRSRDVNGRARPLFELPSRRWQEVEVHLVDLDLGVSHRDWPDEFVLEWLPRTRERMGVTLASLDPRDELAWMYGRLHVPGAPSLPPWG